MSKTNILVIHCFITNYPRTEWLKTVGIYYITVFVGQEFRDGVAEYLCFRVSHEAAVKLLSWDVVSSEGEADWGGSTSIAHHMDLCTGQLASPRVSDPRVSKRKCPTSITLIPKPDKNTSRK